MATDKKDSPKRRTVIAAGAGGLGGAAIATAALKNATGVSTLVDSLAHLSELQASLLLGVLTFTVFVCLIVYLIRGMVERRESEVNSYKEIASTFETLLREELKEIRSSIGSVIPARRGGAGKS